METFSLKWRKGKTMRWIAPVLILSIASSLLANGLHAQDAQKPVPQEPVPQVTSERPMSFWMAQKIDLSKKILESLTKEDFSALEADAKQLRTLGKIEGFVRRQDTTYSRYQQQFDSALLDVANQARNHNVEGATLAFNQLTTSCVICHKRLRQPAADSHNAAASATAK